MPKKAKNPNRVGQGFVGKRQAIARDYVPPASGSDHEALANDATTNRRGMSNWGMNMGLINRAEYQNIRAGINPFAYSANFLDCREAIILCQKAYQNFALLKNVIDVMVELCNAPIYLQGGNQKMRDFVGAWFDRIGLWSLKGQFFREWWRSGTVPLYKFEADYEPQDITRLTQVYGAVASTSIPIRYTIINPADLKVSANIAFNTPTYYKMLNAFELERLKFPKTEEDKLVLKSLGKDAVDEIKKGMVPFIRLDPNNLTVVFNGKQPYEPFSMPFAFPVLKDIDAKMELKRVDMQAARMMDRAMLLITAGAKKEDGGINYATLASLQTLFQNESVIRTLVADYTVKAEWVVPPVKEILGTDKYQQLDKDIEAGLNAILFNTGEKFASTSIKIQVFFERLKQARNAFLNDFLVPEIKALCKGMNAKNYPEPVFEELNLKDEAMWAKIYASLGSYGMLTAKQTVRAIEAGELPLPEEMDAAQEEYKEQRKQGLYLPLVGASLQDGSGMTPNGTTGAGNKPPVKSPTAPGRPTGSKAPQTTKKVSPIGTSHASAFSATKLSQVALAADTTKAAVEKRMKVRLKSKELTEEEQNFASLITQSIMSHEPVDKWATSVLAYVKNPKPLDEAVASEIDEIASEHSVDSYLASILRLTKTEPPKNE